MVPSICKLVPKRQIFNSFMINPLFYVLMIYMYVITFVFVLPRYCNDWAFSKYYSTSLWPNDVMVKRVTDLNKKRIEDAQYYLQRLNANDTLKYYNELSKQDNIDIAIAVVTVKRTHTVYDLNYLTQVLANYDVLFKKEDSPFPRKVLFMCDTFAGPGPHQEALSLAKYFPLVQRYPNGSAHASVMDGFAKETSDYVYCMEQALQYKPKYIIINEDDTLPRPELFPVLKYVLDNLVENNFDSGEHSHNTKPWAYLKLFYPEKWQGYGVESQRLLEMVGIGCVGGILAVMLSFCCRRRDTSLRVQYFDAALGALYFILLAELLGRQYLLEWRRLSKYLYTVINAPDCCSPAILYKADMARQVAAHLNRTQTSVFSPIDLTLDKFVVAKGYMRYLVEPNLMRHIGLFSTLKSLARNPEHFIF